MGRRKVKGQAFTMRRYVIYALLLSLCCEGNSGEERDVCEDLSGCSDSTNGESLYSKSSRWQYYLELTNTSVSSYVPCKEEEEEESCACLTSAVTQDLRTWVERGGVMREDFAAAQEMGYAVHYQIVNHTLFRQQQCKFPSRCLGVEYFLLQLAPSLPDMEMLINVFDYPLSPRRSRPLPVFSFSKTSSEYDIMYPAWSFWAGGPAITTEPRGLGRWDLKRESLLLSNQKSPWERKKDMGFFRGSRTSPERDPLILLSREDPLLVDAQYTKNQAWRSEKDTLGASPADIVTLEDHCQYKYLFNFRGVAASFRLRHLFLCGSLVLHVGHDWLEFFYPALLPWVHYVPLQSDLSDLRDKLEFLKAHDEVAKGIAERGFRFIWEQLTLERVTCYWEVLLLKYAQLCRWHVERQDSYLQLGQ